MAIWLYGYTSAPSGEGGGVSQGGGQGGMVVHVLQVGRSPEGRPCTAVRVGSYAEGFLRGSGVPAGWRARAAAARPVEGEAQTPGFEPCVAYALRRAERLLRAVVEDEAAPREDSGDAAERVERLIEVCTTLLLLVRSQACATVSARVPLPARRRSPSVTTWLGLGLELESGLESRSR
eukprot:scaffold76081_cov33-Phaeocystis_antarctica.AAC.1